MKLEVQRQLEPFFKRLRRASRSLLLLDYDGTLAPFRKERDEALPYPGVTPILQAIVGQGHTRLVIISGRKADEARALLGVHPHPEIWGEYGLQRLHPDGRTDNFQPDDRARETLSAAENWIDYQHLGELAEFKSGSIAVHWRGLDECEAERIRGHVLMGWIAIAQHAGLDLFEFDGGVEIRCPLTDKGDVVDGLLGEMNPDTVAAYLGDDNTDEHAFRAIQDRGLSVLVRTKWRPTAARVWLKPPEELIEFLSQWLYACEQANGNFSNPESGITVNQ